MRGQGLVVITVHLKHQLHTQPLAALLQNIKQVFAPNSAKPVAGRTNDLALKKHLDIVPVVERIANQLAGDRVGQAQVAQRLVAEHHTPAKGVKRLVALYHHDACTRLLLFHQQCKIQTRRPATNA